MANLKTSSLPAAGTLTGSELVGIVQSGGNVRTTIGAIATYAAVEGSSYGNATSFAIGKNASVDGTNSIAIGYDTSNTADHGVAIGSGVSMTGHQAVAIGSPLNSYSIFGVMLGAYSQQQMSFAAVSVGLGNDTTGNKYGIAIGTGNKSYAKSAITIGKGNYASNPFTVAIGYDNTASATSSLAIGYKSNATGIYSLAFGYFASATSEYSLAICGNAKAKASNSVAIGQFSYVNPDGTDGTSIGSHSYTKGVRGNALGRSARVLDDYSVAIGSNAAVYSKNGIAFGRNAYCYGNYGVSIGAYSKSKPLGSMAIGWHSYARTSGGNYGMSVGAFSVSHGGSVSLGPYAYSIQKSAAVGYYSRAVGNQSIAILSHAIGGYAICIGSDSYANYENSVVFGYEASDACQADFVVRGGKGSYQGVIAPTTHEQKFFGTTIAQVNAVAVWSGADWNIYVTDNIDAGSAGNSWRLDINDTTGNAGIPLGLATDSGGKILVVTLATDGSGNVISTIGDVNTLLTNAGYGFTYNSGSPSTVVSSGSGGAYNFPFSGGVDAVSSAYLTADGQIPTSFNLPTVPNGTIARLQGQVIAYFPGLVNGNAGDSAVFTLAPIAVIRDNSGNYTLVGTPTFTLESSSAGASGWSVPTLTVIDSSGQSLFITVTGQNVDLNWIGFISMEATQ